MTVRAVLAAALVCLAAPRIAGAQDARDFVRWRAEPSVVSADGRAEVRMSGTIAPGWKLYSLTSAPPAPAMRVTLDTAGARIDGRARHLRPPVAVFDSLLGVPVEQITGRADVAVPLALSAEAAPDRVALAVRFAVCDASICLPPRTVRVVAPLVAAPVAAAPRAAPVRTPDAVVSPPVRAESVPAAPAPAETPAPVPTGGPVVQADTTPAASPSALSADTSEASVPASSDDGPGRLPRVLFGVLIAAAVLRAVLFVAQRRRERQG